MNEEYNETELFEKNSFFEIIWISDKERIHSSMIGWMLSNDCNVLTDDIKKGFFKSVLGIKTENFKIDEVKNEYKKVDIYIKTDKFNVLIENKLKSTQHSNQLAKYNKTFNLIDEKNYHPFLLSLIEEEPEQSNWKTITYNKVLSYFKQFVDDFKGEEKEIIYLNDYLLFLEKLTVSFNLFHEETSSFEYIFDERYLSNLDKTVDDNLKTFILKNKLSQIFKRSFFTELIQELDQNDSIEIGSRNCRIGTGKGGEVHFTMTIEDDIPFMGFKCRTEIQIEGYSIKFSFTDTEYHTKFRREEFINSEPDIIEIFQKYVDSKKNDFTKLNPPRTKGRVSISRKMKKKYWLMDRQELEKFLEHEIKMARDLTVNLKQKLI